MTRPLIIVPGAYVDCATYARLADQARGSGGDVEVVDVGGIPLAESTARVQALVDGLDEPPVVIAHSFGGAIAGALERVAHLVFLSAFILDHDETAISVLEMADEPAEENAFLAALRPADDGVTVWMDPDAALEVLFNGCEPEVGRYAAGTLHAELSRNFSATASSVQWKTTPTLFIAYRDDHAWPPSLPSKLAKRCDEAVELPGGHCTFACRPQDVVDHLRPLL